MKLRTLGSSGLRLSPLVLGTDNFANPTPEKESIAIIDAAIDAGINLIDTSNSYAKGESERIIGKALNMNGKRNQILLATKVFYPTGPDPDDRGLSRTAIMKACEASLRRLGTESIDLYQLHRPDWEVPHEETLRAMDDLVRQGKVRFIGSSTAPARRVREGIEISERNHLVRFVSEQSPYNLLDRRIENEMVPLCSELNIGLLTWSPLAMGMLTGRYSSSGGFPEGSRGALRGGIYAERITPAGIEVGNRFVDLANTAGYDPARLALLWVKDQPGITAPIMGPRTLEQLHNFLPVLEITLPDELRTACDKIVEPGEKVADFFNTA